MSYDMKYHAFLTAIERGDYNDVVRMISSGAFRVNEEILYYFEDRGRYIVTPLHWAVRHNHPKLCQYLLSHGAEPYRHQVQEYFPLHEACDKGFCEVLQKFIDVKCDLNYPTSEKDTPLHVACMRGNISCVHALLAAGADLNAKNVVGHTPLETALYNGHRDLEALFEAHSRIAVALPVCSSHWDRRFNGTPVESDQPSRPPRKQALGKDARAYLNQKPCPSMCSSHVSPSNLLHPSSSSIRHSQSFHQVGKGLVKHTRSFRQPGKASELWQGSGDQPSAGGCHNNYHHHHHHPLDSWQDLGDSLEQRHGTPGGPSEQHKPSKGSQLSVDGGDALDHLQRSAKMRPKHSLYESNSSPEFVVPMMESLTGRTQSYDQLILPHYRGREAGLAPPLPPPTTTTTTTTTNTNTTLPVSPARERIDQVSQAMWQSFESIAGSLPLQVKHPFAGTFNSLFLGLCPAIELSEEQFLSVRETSCFSPRHVCSRRHTAAELGNPVDYRLLGPPLDPEPRVTYEGYCTLDFQASLVSNGHLLSGEESILKLTLQVFTVGQDSPYHLSYLAKVLSSLPPHPNVATAVHMFVGSCTDISAYLKRLRPPLPPSLSSSSTSSSPSPSMSTGPSNPCYIYAPMWKNAEHIFMPVHDLTLGRYFGDLKLKHPQPPFGVCEEEVLITLSQILLGVAHLNRHHVLHCTISPSCIHYHKQKNLIAVGDLDGSISLCDLREESLRTALWGLSGEGSTLFVAPEVHCIMHKRDGKFPAESAGGDLSLFVSKSDSFAVGRMIYELFHVSGCVLNWEHMVAEGNVPMLTYFSPQLNRILRGLVAYNPTNRIPASQGAFNCLVLLFGPHMGRVQSAEDCHKWMFSESMELYMHPVLKGSVENTMDAKSKLHYMYLAMADPEKVWEACQFLS